MLAFASSRAAALESKKLKHSFAGRRRLLRPVPPLVVEYRSRDLIDFVNSR